MSDIEINTVYQLDKRIFEMIREIGGEWYKGFKEDGNQDATVFIIQSGYPDIYWAIPVGILKHRHPSVIRKIEAIIDNTEDYRNSNYSIVRLSQRTIFFISDVIPVHKSLIQNQLKYPNSSTALHISNKDMLEEIHKKTKKIIHTDRSYKKKTGKHIFRQKIDELLKKMQNI